MELRGAEGLNCACTFRKEPKAGRNRCRACSTIKPEIIALVVAIAGMMFPAISRHRMSMNFPRLRRRLSRTFDFPAALLWNAVSCCTQICRGMDEMQRIGIVLLK